MTVGTGLSKDESHDTLWLNERGHLRRGRKFSTGNIHEILTSTTYHGQHYFNRFDSRNRRPRPPSEWVPLAVPAIIEERVFDAVQGLLHSRDPRRVAPRIVNGPTFLAGLARCGYCGAALIQNTGKGGQYRYYACSKKLKEGPTSCRGLRMPMPKLDDIVVGEVARLVLEPKRLGDMIEGYVKAAADRGVQDKDRLARSRAGQKDAEASITRLLQLVENNVMDPSDPALRERMIALKLTRDEMAREAGELQKIITSGQPTITQEKITRVAEVLRDKLYNGTPEFRQAYARLLMDEINVTDDEIRISGSTAVLARAVSEGMHTPMPPVLSYVREWRPQRDSNPRYQRERLVS